MTTKWQVKTNVLYEMSCFLNVLCIDKPYQDYYKEDYGYWMNAIYTTKLERHFDLVRTKIYDGRHQIISSEICLYFSMLSSNPSIEDVLNITVEDLKTIREKAEKTYWDEDNWNAFKEVLPSIQTIFQELSDNGFQEYWNKKYKNSLETKCKEIQNNINHIDIVSEIERICEKEIPDNKIDLFIVHFTLPHCIKLYGNKLIGMSLLSPITMAWIALHEMIHTPYKYEDDIREIIDDLKNEPLIKEAVENHEKWLGYNTYETFFDEQCTKALDHYLGESLGLIPNDAINGSVEERQKQDDGGIHILFPVIYYLLKSEYDYSQSFQHFIVNMHKKGKLTIEPTLKDRANSG